MPEADNRAYACSPGEFKKLALDAGGYDRWRRYNQQSQESKCMETYGVCSKTMCDLWTAMRNSQDPCIHLPPDARPIHLLLALRFLWTYDTESELGRFFKILSENTVRKWVRFYVPRMQLLLKEKIGKIEDYDEGLVFTFSIDGTHCPVEELRPFSTRWSSHKLGGKPGLNYEIAITINNPRLAWVHGPTPPGAMNDLKVFRSRLLKIMKEMLPGRRLIGDDGYNGEPSVISTKNEFDPKEVKEFKNRVMARHENFNQRLKCFGVLKKHYRHSDRFETHGICFRAVCVCVVFQMENGYGLLSDPYP